MAWLKVQFFLHGGGTEVGGFGVSRPGDPLYVEDFVTVVQTVSGVTVEFDDESVADFFDDMVDRGMTPAQFARIWVHTHPGSSATPSSVDERTFERVFGGCDWAVMFIVSRTGRTYARLRFSAGPGAAVLLPVAVDWPGWAKFVTEHPEGLGQLLDAWMDEYGANVRPEPEAVLRACDRSADAASTVGATGGVTVPSDRELLPDWDEPWWEADAELAALAQMEAELDHDAVWSRRYDPDFDRHFDDERSLFP